MGDIKIEKVIMMETKRKLVWIYLVVALVLILLGWLLQRVGINIKHILSLAYVLVLLSHISYFLGKDVQLPVLKFTVASAWLYFVFSMTVSTFSIYNTTTDFIRWALMIVTMLLAIVSIIIRLVNKNKEVG